MSLGWATWQQRSIGWQMESLATSNMPFIWHKFSGYLGRDFRVKPSDILLLSLSYLCR
jgi:hypothetical protein